MATLSIKIDDEVKRLAEKEFKEIGISTSTAVNIYFRKVIKEHGIPFMLGKKLDIESNIETNDDFIKLPKRNNVKRYKIENKNGKLFIPDNFPKELEEAWAL